MVLGFRLDPEVQQRLDRFVRRRGLRKSEVARSALVDYLDRHDDDDEFERQVAALAAFERQERRQDIDELDSSVWRTIDDL